MEIKIKDTAIQNIVNGLKVKEENKKYYKGLAEDAKRDEKYAWLAEGFETKYEIYAHEINVAYQVLADISTELYEMVKNEVEAN